MIFADRTDAGRQLAKALGQLRDRDPLVLALPRGGVVVGYEVAAALGAPLDVFVTRKIGAPANPEYAIGAISETGDVQVNRDEIAFLGIDDAYLARELGEQRREIQRRAALYRDGHPLTPTSGRTVILVDDGIATGFTMFASVRAIRATAPRELLVAVPVAPPPTVSQLRREVDRVEVLHSPEPFYAVGNWYGDFSQVSDEEVTALLARRRGSEASRHNTP